MDLDLLLRTLLIAGLVALAVWRQFRERAVTPRNLFVLPAAVALLGSWEIARGPAPSLMEGAILALNLAVAIGLGLWRGASMRVWRGSAGEARAKGGWPTLARWGATLLARLALDGGVALLALGVSPLFGLPLVAAATLGAQNLVVWRRALSPTPPGPPASSA